MPANLGYWQKSITQPKVPWIRGSRDKKGHPQDERSLPPFKINTSKTFGEIEV